MMVDYKMTWHLQSNIVQGKVKECTIVCKKTRSKGKWITSLYYPKERNFC